MDYTKEPSSYTPTNDTAPKFGQSGAGVLALQKKINQTNAGKAGYVPLKEDSLYGPKTYAAAMANANISSTSGPARTEFSKNSLALDNALKLYGINNTPNPEKKDTGAEVVTDPYMQQLNSMATSGDATTSILVKNIQAAKQRQAGKIDKQYADYKGGLQLLGIQHNEAQSSPDLLAGHIQEAESQHQDKIQELNDAETKALLEADQARKDNNFKILKEKMDYVKQLKKDKVDELTNYYNTVSNQSKTAAIEAHDIYDALNTLEDDQKEQFIQAVAKKFNLPVGSLVTALADEKSKRETSDLKTQNTESIIAKRNKTGSGSSTKPAGKDSGKLTKDQISQFSNALENRGSDGFIDPYEYKKAYDAWVSPSNGGTAKGFLAQFPPKNYVNPKAKNLPSILMPAKKTTSNRAS